MRTDCRAVVILDFFVPAAPLPAYSFNSVASEIRPDIVAENRPAARAMPSSFPPVIMLTPEYVVANENRKFPTSLAVRRFMIYFNIQEV